MFQDKVESSEKSSIHQLDDNSLLLQCNKSIIRTKDFSLELRAGLDVEEFLHQGKVCLGIEPMPIENLIDFALSQGSIVDDLFRAEARECLLLTNSSSDQIKNYIQGADLDKSQNIGIDRSWLIAFCSITRATRRHMTLLRIEGKDDAKLENLRFFMIIICPKYQKETKSSLETARTFATLFSSGSLRKSLMEAKSEALCKALFMINAKILGSQSCDFFSYRSKYPFDAKISIAIKEKESEFSTFEDEGCKSQVGKNILKDMSSNNTRASVYLTQLESFNEKINLDCNVPDSSKKPNEQTKSLVSILFDESTFGKGFCEDLKRRLPLYISDFRDAFVGPKNTIQKTVATIWFLYFGILLPIIAFSSLLDTLTGGHMGNLKKTIIGQAIGGLIFAFLGGQPLVIIMTTAPLCLYTKTMYAAVGLWNFFFLFIYSMFGFSRLMNLCTRGTEEVFAMFIVIAFITDASKDALNCFEKYYLNPDCNIPHSNINGTLVNSTSCHRDSSILFLLLMLTLVWISVKLYNFRKTPYFTPKIRTLLSDYALPIGVLITSYIGSHVFQEIYVEEASDSDLGDFVIANIQLLPLSGVLLSMALGFMLSILFFMDQNISAAMVSSREHNLKKGTAYHYDLMIVGLLNVGLTMVNLPMMHGVLPHSPLHARSLADIEHQLDNGHLVEVENRVTAIVSHLLIFASLLLIPNPISFIPRAVLNGLFLYMAITSLDGLNLYDRILLLFTEQAKYAPSKMVRMCSQKSLHYYTLLQLFQLFLLCFFGFMPLKPIEMFFPVIILMFIPFRLIMIPKIVDERYLAILDPRHEQ